MFLNPIVANLHNVQTNRFHPILFIESPLPGPPSDDKPIRHKSKGHHTEGFETREEAIAHCQELIPQLIPDSIGEPRLCIDKDFPWDGDDIPAMVVVFIERDGKLQPA